MSRPSWVESANGFGAGAATSLYHKGQRPRSASLQPYSQGFHDLRLDVLPTRWHPEYSRTGSANMQRSQGAGGTPFAPSGASVSSWLAPIPEDAPASDDRMHSAHRARATSDWVSAAAQRRHSEGDLLAAAADRWRFAKRAPSQQDYRRRGTQGDIHALSDHAVGTALSTLRSGKSKRRLSVGAWPDDRSEGSDKNDSSFFESRSAVSRRVSRTSDPGLAQRRQSLPLTPSRQNSEAESSQDEAEEVTQRRRRKSEADLSQAGDQLAKDGRRRSAISLAATAVSDNGGTGPSSAFAAVEVPIELFQPPIKRLSKVLGPVIMCLLVITLAGSLAAAFYFAVVFSRSQAKEIEYLRAILRFHLENSESQKLVSMTTSQKDTFDQQFCKEIDSYYRKSALASKYKGCNVYSIDQQELGLLLFFDSPLNATSSSEGLREDAILNVLTSSAPRVQENSDVRSINNLQVKLSMVSISLEVPKMAPDSQPSKLSSSKDSAQPSVGTTHLPPPAYPAVTTLSPVTAMLHPTHTSTPDSTQMHMLSGVTSVVAMETRTAGPRDPMHPCQPHESDARYRYPGSCSIFFQCLNGRPITLSCGETLVFDITLKVCKDTVTDCLDTPDNTQTSDAARQCEVNGGQYYPHPGACNMYIQCSNNKTNVRICPDELVFSPLTSTCVPLAEDLPCPAV